jgi:hypothetical protein
VVSVSAQAAGSISNRVGAENPVRAALMPTSGSAGSGPGGIGCLAVGAGGVWVTRGGERRSLVRIDPSTNRLVETVDIPNPDYWNEVGRGGRDGLSTSVGQRPP